MRTIEKKIKEYNEKINVFEEYIADSTEMYGWIIDLGKKVKEDPLSEHLRIEDNRVSRCQFNLFVYKEGAIFKAFSDGFISSGYAAILLNIFNSLTLEEQGETKIEDFDGFKIKTLLTMSRADSFYQMVDMMIKRI